MNPIGAVSYTHLSAGDQVRIDMAQIAAQELKEIGMDVSVEIPAQTDWACLLYTSRCV